MTGISRFRTSWTHVEGNVPAMWVQCKVVNVNLVNWTVDVLTQFDRKRYFDVQVGSPYMHYSNGEGLSIFPEVGAKCMVCLPSDSSPPFVGAFIMPLEVTDMAAADAPNGTTSQPSPGATSSGASFAGGRPQAKPGDIWLRTRDDNFVILHRGGVLQLGASELAQRIYIPLGHLVMDISQNFAHHNAGGSILWGLQDGPALENFPAEYAHSFRVFANDAGADIRIKAGKVSDPIPEPKGDAGNQGDVESEKLGKGDDFIVYEVVVAKAGFNPETGSPIDSSVSDKAVLRFFFDRAGGTFLRCSGSLVLSTKKRLLVRAQEGIDVNSQKEITMTAKGGITLDGGGFAHLKAGVVRLGPGNKPVAQQGGLVQVAIPAQVLPVVGGGGGTVNVPPLVVWGTIVSGEPTVLV